MFKYYITSLFFLSFFCINCTPKNSQAQKKTTKVGAENTALYFPTLKGKKVAVVCNQTSLIGDTHLVDSLLNAGIKISKIFSPEHGFRGQAEAGESVIASVDTKTGLPIISLYGKKKKPSREDLNDVGIVVFDIQDVGVRFYTYISTLHYVMEACAEYSIPLIVLDRPNPNAYFIDGPVLEKEFASFVGMHPVPIVYGMTIGEYARMINGEKWLAKKQKCKLSVIPLQNWNHKNTSFIFLVKPSPNLPNMTSVFLYPSLCLFEGTKVSVGRGTDFPFQVYGHPSFTTYKFSFTPRSIPGAAVNPKLNAQKCYGTDLRNEKKSIIKREKLNLNYLLDAYRNFLEKDKFFNSFFNKLSGNSTLKQQIINGLTEDEIRQSWQKDLENFKKIRKKYLLYK